MKNAQAAPIIIVTVGVAAIIGAFVLFGRPKEQEQPELTPTVPVPFDPPDKPLLGNAQYFEYKGVYIEVSSFTQGLSGDWKWTMRGAPELSTAPLAVSSTSFDAAALALDDAMAARDTQLGG